jgi:hypothetical protein
MKIKHHVRRKEREHIVAYLDRGQPPELGELCRVHLQLQSRASGGCVCKEGRKEIDTKISQAEEK